MSRSGSAFRSLRNLAVAADHPVSHGADIIKAASFEVWIRQKIRYHRNAVDERVGVRVTQTDVHELQRCRGAVGNECVAIMLKHNRTGIECSGGGRSDGVVDESAASGHLNIKLERTAGGLTEDARIKLD